MVLRRQNTVFNAHRYRVLIPYGFLCLHIRLIIFSDVLISSLIWLVQKLI